MSRRAPCPRLDARSGIMAGAALLALLAGACGREPEPVQPLVASCVVEGQVCRIPVDVSESAVRFNRVGSLAQVITADTDDAGRYRIELPAGDYRVAAVIDYEVFWLTPTGTMDRGSSLADTVRLSPASSPRRIDFRFGALSLAGLVPAGLRGADLIAELYARDDDPQDGLIDGGTTRSITIAMPDSAFQMDVGAIPEGSYHVRMRWQWDYEDQGETFWLPGTAHEDSAAWFRVGPDSLTIATVGLSGEPARLTGRISGAWLAMGLTPPRVSAFDADSILVAGPCMVRDDGVFTLRLFRPVPVRLVVERGLPRYWLGGPAYEAATVFAAAPGEVIDGIDVSVPGALVSITNSGSLRPSSSVQLEFRDPVDRTLVMSTWASTSYRTGLSGLWPGTYLLHIIGGGLGDEDWRPQWYDRAATPELATPVTVPADGGVLQLDLVLEPGGVILGQTDLGVGTVDRYAMAVITTADEHVCGGQDWLYSAGTAFAFTGLPDGAYKVGVYLAPPFLGVGQTPSDAVVWYPGTTDWSAATTLSIAAADTISGLFITAPGP